MRNYVVRAGRVIDAPIERIWSLVADASGYRNWTAMTTTKLEREGEPAPDGVGAIRNFGTGSVVSREEVTHFDPPTHLGYRLLSGLPIEDYHADVRLLELGPSRTKVTWVGTFRCGTATGVVMERFLRFVLGDFVRRLAREAVRGAR